MTAEEVLLQELQGRLLAHRVFIQRLVHRLRNVEGFQSSGLEHDIRKIEASIADQLEAQNLPEGLIEACEEELEAIGNSVNAGRTQD